MSYVRSKGDKVPAFVHPDVIRLGLKKGVIRVYLQLVFRGGPSGWSKISAGKLKEEIGDMGLRQVKEALTELDEEGLIHRDQRPDTKGGSSAFIYVLAVDQWLAKRASESSPEEPSESDPRVPPRNAESSSEEPSLYKDEVPLNKSRKKGSAKRKTRIQKALEAFRPTDPVPSDWVADQTFVEAWDGWVEARAERNKGSITERAAKLASSQLMNPGKLGRIPTLPEAITQLEKATVGGWSGMYPVEPSNGSKPKRDTCERPADQVISNVKEL